MKKRQPCSECKKITVRIHPILRVPLCLNCQMNNREKFRYISKTRALGEYRLKPNELSGLRSHLVDNPHYKKAAPMKLYLLSQVAELAKDKWGSKEPYQVNLIDFPDDFYNWLLQDLERLKKIGEEKFQNLIADCLERMGLSVQSVGHVYQKDGGIDIIAYPNKMPFPFLLGVQIKHHHTDRKTGSADVRDIQGVLTSRSSPFHMGMVVTNTSFTADAKWFASNNSTLLRLRDLQDLQRWFKNDYVNESEWREIPDEIELAPGVKLKIPKPDSLETENI